MKKYELTDEKNEWLGITLHRIRALKDFGDVKAGDLGGWIEKESNLSHGGTCWVDGNARVDEDARVDGNARVSGDAWVDDNARVSGDAWVDGNARVSGDAWVDGNVRVSGDAWVDGDVRVSGDAWVDGDAFIKELSDWCLCTGFGSKLRTTTAYRTRTREVEVICGCFEGSLEEFATQVEETHGDNQFGKEYQAMIQLFKAHFGLV